ncbi:hypothetical protein H8958_004270, partial [Nasalis larvatus]
MRWQQNLRPVPGLLTSELMWLRVLECEAGMTSLEPGSFVLSEDCSSLSPNSQQSPGVGSRGGETETRRDRNVVSHLAQQFSNSCRWKARRLRMPTPARGCGFMACILETVSGEAQC